MHLKMFACLLNENLFSAKKCEYYEVENFFKVTQFTKI